MSLPKSKYISLQRYNSFVDITSKKSFFQAILIGSISTCNLSGPIGIAEITGDVAQQGVFPFFSLLASISLALAIFNLLPIPPFDGFHMAFTASNWILGGRVPYQVMNGISLLEIYFLSVFFYLSVGRILFAHKVIHNKII